MVQPQMGTMTRWFLILLSGCSMALSGPSPDRPRSKPPQCDTSKSLVFVDALLASTLGIVAVSVASNNGGDAVIPLIGAGVFVASAVHGNNVVNECNREIGNYNSEQLASGAPDPDADTRQAIVAPRAPLVGPPAVAMQPTVATQPQPQPPPPQQPQPQPQPQPQSQPQPQTEPQPSNNQPWASFWKEAP